MPTILERARAAVVLDHPFFASILLRRPMVSRKDIPTAAIDARGTIYYNPDFIEKLSVQQAVWVLCHEVLHYASMHPIRRGTREPMPWNVVGDMWINDMLAEMKIGEAVPNTISAPGSCKETVEDLYAKLPRTGNGGKGKGQKGQKGQGQKGGGQPDGDGNGDPMEGDIEIGDEPLTDSEKGEIEGNTKIEIAEAGQAAKMRGKLPGLLADFIAQTVESKVPWFDILERFMTERVKNDMSWARPNRRYMAASDPTQRFYLPTIDGIGAMGEIVVQVDISGSVSQPEIEHYNGHLKRIVEQCHPQKVHVIYTDTQVQKHEEFENPDDMEIRFYSGGGTDMRAGFDYIESKGITPEVFVTLTDGYTPFPDHTAVPAIWCISSDVKSPTGETIHFKVEDR